MWRTGDGDKFVPRGIARKRKGKFIGGGGFARTRCSSRFKGIDVWPSGYTFVPARMDTRFGEWSAQSTGAAFGVSCATLMMSLHGPRQRDQKMWTSSKPVSMVKTSQPSSMSRPIAP